MKSPAASTVLGIAALGSTALAAVTMDISRTAKANLKRRGLSARATITEALANNATGGDYIAQVSVGTPAQQLTLAIDTGSSDVWVISSNADLCTSAYEQEEAGDGCTSTYNSGKSSTFKDVDPGGFYIQYADQSGAEGDYIQDTFSIGGATIKGLEMGLAYNVTLDTGLLGIGYDTNEASESSQTDDVPFQYPSIIDQMVSQGLISSKAYSLYLNDLEASTGSIIFGGLDADKYTGSLLQVPIIPTTLQNGSTIYTDFTVAMTGFSITGQAGNTTSLTTNVFKESSLLDSGTTLTYVPDELADLIYKELNAYQDNEGDIYVDCAIRDSSPKMTFNYAFGGPTGINISVPITELIFDLTGLFSTDGYTVQTPFSNPCALGLAGNEGDGTVLGDTFLRSAYVVYDLSNNLIALAQTNFNSTTSSIVEFQTSATSIPQVSGVASSATGVTNTATEPIAKTKSVTSAPAKSTSIGDSGIVSSLTAGTAVSTTTESSSSGTATGTAASTSSKSAAVGAVPVFDIRALAVLGVASVFAMFGGVV